MFRLTPPTHAVFYISVALAIIAVVLRFLAYRGTPLFHTGGYVVLLVGYLVLLAGVTLKGA
jgi:hypothetical protein